ncbi:MAG: toll/interleukin-1 receptor domain-containing protein [Blastocatellia bacterium]
MNSSPRSENIFISYRRDDAAGHAGRLYDALSQRFPNRVFMDINKIEAGDDFVEVLDKAVGDCAVLLALIGRDWARITGADGKRRLENPNDFVRIEVASALKRNIRVIPVLVENAPMPNEADLPPDLDPLTRRNALEISDKRWDYDVDQLSRVLEKEIYGADYQRPVSHGTGDGAVAHRLTSTGTGDGSVPAKSMSLWKKLAIGAGSLLALLFIIGLFTPEEETASLAGASATTTPAATGAKAANETVTPPAGRAIVSGTQAEFIFPVENTQQWKWFLAESKPDEDEYSWQVLLDGSDGHYEFHLYEQKSRDDRPRTGDLKSFLQATGTLILRGNGKYTGRDLSLSARPGPAQISLLVTGPRVAKIFAGKPEDVTFEVVSPGKPGQSVTVPVTYQN